MHVKCMLWFESCLPRSRGCIFPGAGNRRHSPRVRLAGTGLWPAISGLSVLWAQVSGAGLCSRLFNFRFAGAETGSGRLLILIYFFATSKPRIVTMRGLVSGIGGARGLGLMVRGACRVESAAPRRHALPRYLDGCRRYCPSPRIG
jgi:hypothetical protein